MSFAMYRMIPKQKGLLRNTTSILSRASSVQTQASTSATTSTVNLTEDFANLTFAPEKPTPAPRFIKSAESITFEANGDVNVKLIKFENEEEIETLQLNGSVFGVPPRNDILQRVVRWQLANRRSGNHKTKTRSEVSGSTRKPWKQKGTGRARVGDIRAPQWRGGYTVHGPVVRDHSYSLPKKVRAMGLRVALSTKLREGKLAIVDQLEIENPKTKLMRELLYQRRWDHALFIDGQNACENFYLSTRNLPYVDVLSQEQINVYSILQKDLLIITADAVKYLEERLATE